MEEGNKSSHAHEYETPAVAEAGAAGKVEEVKDRGLFDRFGKKDEQKRQEEVIVTEFDEKVQVSEAPHEHKKEEKEEEQHEKKHSLLEKLHRSGSGSSSSSDEEEGEDGEKKKKKKEKKKKKDHEVTDPHNTTVPAEKYEDASPQPEEKKGFMEKIKEKLPGAKKTPGEDQHDHQEHIPTPPPPPVVEHAPHTEGHVSSTETTHDQGGEGKEKKGLLEKIKEKLPGYHAKSTGDQDDKEKEKESGSY